MAKSTKTTVTRTIQTGVTLELSNREALVLANILAHVTPNLNSYADDAYAIRESLSDAGISSNTIQAVFGTLTADYPSKEEIARIDVMEQGKGLSEVTTPELDRLVRHKERIPAIKLLRELVNPTPGLKETKEEIGERIAKLNWYDR